MKHFSLGFLLGSLIASGLAFVPDPRSGRLIKKEVKSEVASWHHDISDLASNLGDSQMALKRLQDGMKIAQPTIETLSTALNTYTQDLKKEEATFKQAAESLSIPEKEKDL